MKRKTVRNHKDFFAPHDAPCIANSFFVIKMKPAKIPGDARYGLVVPKKIFKLAVLRNRAKRVIRDWIAYNEDFMLDDFDYIFILREPILHLDRDSGRRKMQIKLKEISKAFSGYAIQK